MKPLYRPIPLKNIDVRFQWNTCKPNPRTYEKDYLSQSSWVHPKEAGMAQHTWIYKYNALYKSNWKTRNHMITSLDEEKVSTKLYTPSW